MNVGVAIDVRNWEAEQQYKHWEDNENQEQISFIKMVNVQPNIAAHIIGRIPFFGIPFKCGDSS